MVPLAWDMVWRIGKKTSHASSIFNLQTHQVQIFKFSWYCLSWGALDLGHGLKNWEKNSHTSSIFNLQTPQLILFNLSWIFLSWDVEIWRVLCMYVCICSARGIQSNPRTTSKQPICNPLTPVQSKWYPSRVFARTQGVCPYIYVYIYCLSIAYWLSLVNIHVFSQNGYGPWPGCHG